MKQLLLFPDLQPPSLKDLVYNRKHITFENIKHLKCIELEVICKLMAIPISGTKSQKIFRILNLWDLRNTLTGFDSSYERAEKLSNQYRHVELHDMCRRAKIWRSGNKISLACILIKWRDIARKRGQEFFIQAKDEHRKQMEVRNAT